MHFDFSRQVLRLVRGYFEHQSRVQFEGCVADPPPTTRTILPGSTWSVLLLGIVMQDAMSEVLNVFAVDHECVCGWHRGPRVGCTTKVLEELKEAIAM